MCNNNNKTALYHNYVYISTVLAPLSSLSKLLPNDTNGDMLALMLKLAYLSELFGHWLTHIGGSIGLLENKKDTKRSQLYELSIVLDRWNLAQLTKIG